MLRYFCKLLVGFPGASHHRVGDLRNMAVLNRYFINLKDLVGRERPDFQLLDLCLINQIAARKSNDGLELGKLAKIYLNDSTPVQTKIYLVKCTSMIMASGRAQEENWEQSTGGAGILLLNMLNHENSLEGIFKGTNEGRAAMVNAQLTLNLPKDAVQDLIALPFNVVHQQLNDVDALKECLLTATSLAVRLSLQNTPSQSMALSHLLSLIKSTSQFQYANLSDKFNESEPPNVQLDEWTSSIDQLFWRDLSDQTLLEFTHVFYDFLLAIPTENNEAILEKLNFRNNIYQLLTQAYKIAKRDNLHFKRLGLKIMCQLVLILQDCHEEGDEDSSDEAENARKKKKRPVGPLLLEQYEAQIQSVIVSCLQDLPQSMVIQKELCRLVELFIGLGICQDQQSAATVMGHVFGNLQYKPGSASQASGSSDESPAGKVKDQTWISLSQMVPETVCLNACMIKLKMVAKIQIIRMEQAVKKGRRSAGLGPLGVDVELEKHYIAKMNEFLGGYLKART